jgi:hypothetical protein
MLIPLKQFICDTCGEVIERPEDGWVEWISTYDEARRCYMKYGFRICHHSGISPLSESNSEGCYFYSNEIGRSDMHLDNFIDENYKMAQILSFLDIGAYHDPNYEGTSVRNMREYVEFVRRITIPYFEEARQYWEEAISDGYFGDANELWIYGSNNLKKLIERYSDHQ